MDAPFAPEIWRQAMLLASQYQLVIAPSEELGYLGRTIEMPFAMSDGKTIEQCARSTLEATASGIAVMLENGERPPAPSREAARTQQVNIRISPDEKMQLEAIAKRDGFRSLSDLVRAAALRALR